MIKSSDDNTLFSDFALGFTQSLATTGVSTMTAPLIGAAGLVTSPGYTFNGSKTTGLYLAGTNQIGVANNGIQTATFNADNSVTFAAAIGGKGAVPVGAVMDFAGSAAPAGWLLCFGQLVSTTTYAALFAALGATYGSGSGTFGIPDYRGRAIFGQDNMGGSAAGRITNTLNFDGTILGNSGGNQLHTLTQAELPAVGIALSGSTSGYTPTVGGVQELGVNAGTPIAGFNIAASSSAAYSPNSYGAVAGFGSLSVSGSTNAIGSNASHAIMNPAIIANKIIFAGV